MYDALQHYASIGYALLISVLMLAMIGAFIWAHVSYNENIEKAKTDPLKVENTILIPCFYCGADERLLKIILISLIGSFFLGSISILIWAWRRGTFRNVEQTKFTIFDIERRR